MTPLRYWRVAVPITVGYSHRAPNMTVELPGRDPVSGVQFAWVSNTTPWTYSNSRPMVTNPCCSFESGLGVFAVTSMKVIPTLGLLRQILAKNPEPEAKQLVRDDNAACLRITCADGPVASQYDGEYLGRRESMTFRAVREVLPVAAPQAHKCA